MSEILNKFSSAADQVNKFSSLVNQTITINDFIAKFPFRRDFRDTSLDYDNRISCSKPLDFIPSKVHDGLLMNPYGYAIILYGALADGQRGIVAITGILPYFYVLVPRGKDPRNVMSDINLALPDDKMKPQLMEIVTNRREFMGWQPNAQTFIRMEYKSNYGRTAAINKLGQAGWKTYHNEKNNYFRTVSRDTGKTISSWVNISNYTVEDHPDYGRIFKVSMDNYQPIKEFKKNPALARDKQLVLAWDIEVADPTGDFPVPESKESKLFMIAGSCHWHSQNNPLIQVCFVDHPTLPSIAAGNESGNENKNSRDNLKPNYVTVVCGSEANVILGFAYFFNRMQPDYCIGFNVADFDWRWLCVRAYQYGMLSQICDLMDEYKDNYRANGGTTHPLKSLTYETFVRNQKAKDKDSDISLNKYLSVVLDCYKYEKIKIDAETYAEGHQLQFMGCISYDVRTIFRGYFPQSEKSSLNFFLDKSKLRSKKDMPISEMNKIYWKLTNLLKTVTSAGVWQPEQIPLYQKLQEGMREIAEYCVIDSFRCQELVQKQGVVFDKRGVADLAFCSINDSFMYAGGMKVINLVAHYVEREGYVMNHIMPEGRNEKRKDKFPGAYVLNPKPGLVTSKLNFEERIEANEEYMNKFHGENNGSFRHLRYPKLHKICDDNMRRAETVIQVFKETIQDSFNRSSEDKYKNLRVSAATDEQVNRYIELAREKLKHKLTPNYQEQLYKGEQPLELELSHGEAEAFREFLVENNGRPIAGLDFNSLYPSIIITYNLSPEKTISKVSCDNSDTLMLEKIKQAKDMGLFCNQQKFPYEGSTVYGFFVWHENRKGIRQSKMTMEEKASVDFHRTYGIIPQMLLDLMALRKLAKEPKEYFEKIIEHFNSMKDQNFKYHNATSAGEWDPVDELVKSADGIECKSERNREILSVLKLNRESYRKIIEKGRINIPEMVQVNEILEIVKSKIDFDPNTKKRIGDAKLSDIAKALDIDPETREIALDDLEYFFSYYNSKQNALKLIMNTTYGKMGDSRSPICDIALAGAVTSYGQACLRKVESYLRNDLECGVWYGDTDSMYKSVPEKFFIDIDKQYYSGSIPKIKYWEECVKIEFREVDGIRDQVNKMIREFTRTDQLNMAYEEVLFPSAWLSKKKYYGLPHYSEPNFSNTKLFIRGLETKKRGVSEALRIIVENLLNITMRPSNINEISDLVYAAVDNFYTRTWKLDDFAKAIQYKPKTAVQRADGKGNKAVLSFADRMAKEGIEVKPYERIKIVKVKRYPYKFDERGRKKNRGQGDFMELLEVAKAKNYEVNIDDYMKSGIAGQLARLIVYREEFFVESVDSSDAAIKEANEQMIKRAKTHVVSYASRYFTKYENVGPLLKKCYGSAQTQLVNILKSTGNYNMGMKMLMKDYEEDSFNDEERFFRFICDEIDKKTEKAAKAEKFNITKSTIAQMEIEYSEENIIKMKASVSGNINQIYVQLFKPTYAQLKVVIDYNNKFIAAAKVRLASKLDLITDGEYKFSEKDIAEKMNQLEALSSATHVEISEQEKLWLDQANKTMSDNLTQIKELLTQQYSYINRINAIAKQIKDFKSKGVGLSYVPSVSERQAMIREMMKGHGDIVAKLNM